MIKRGVSFGIFTTRKKVIAHKFEVVIVFDGNIVK